MTTPQDSRSATPWSTYPSPLEPATPLEPGSPLEPAPEAVRRDPSFYSDHIVFQVGMGLFKVPRCKFEEGSEVFRDMFAVPPGDNVVEGLTDEHPLLLESISTDEFRSLLRVMFRPHYGPTAEETMTLSLDEWIHVLKLTTMWGFDRLRPVAIDILRPLLEQEDPVRWVTLARKYEVYEWLLPSLHALARRQTAALQVDEVGPLGIVTVVKMAEVRESFPFGSGNSYYSGYASERANFEQEIRRVFKEELREIEPASSGWGGFY